MFKFNGELVSKAHKETKKIKKEFPEINYSFQFGLEMKYLLSKIKRIEDVIKMDKVEMVQQELKKVCKEHDCLTEKIETRIDNIMADFKEDEKDMGNIRTWTSMERARNLYDVYVVLVNDFRNEKLRNGMINREYNHNFDLSKIFKSIRL